MEFNAVVTERLGEKGVFDQKTTDRINATRMILDFKYFEKEIRENGHLSFLNKHFQDYCTAIKKVTNKGMSHELVRAELSGLLKFVSDFGAEKRNNPSQTSAQAEKQDWSSLHCLQAMLGSTTDTGGFNSLLQVLVTAAVKVTTESETNFA